MEKKKYVFWEIFFWLAAIIQFAMFTEANNVTTTPPIITEDISNEAYSWSSWGSWSPCSKSCGGGVAVQERHCLPRTRNVSSTNATTASPVMAVRVTRQTKGECLGVAKRYHECNTAPCPGGLHDMRAEQCAAYDRRPFRGRFYTWVPYIDGDSPCMLNCRPLGQHFYASLALVADGTPCTKPGFRAICVQGNCKYWADIKHKAKARAAAKRRDACGTGGGPSQEDDLSEVDQKILSIIGEAAVFGDTQHRVPVFETQNEPHLPMTQDILPVEDVVVINVPEADVIPEAINSPSKSGHTRKIFSIKTPIRRTSGDSNVDVLGVQAGTASPKGNRPKPKRSLFPKPDNIKKSNVTKVEPWVVELEQRRITAEEKLADAAMIIAEAARTNAQSASVIADCTRMQCEIMLKLIETMKK